MNRSKADGVGWVLQFIFGFVFGCLLSFAAIRKGRYSTGYWLNSGVVLYFILGAGLLGGESVLVGLVGVGLMAFAVLKTLGAL